MSQQELPGFIQEPETRNQKPVECLGITFENDEKRREYFLEKMRKKLKDAEFRKIEGFPIGEDEDILALSDPPYYTACPNPFIGDFIKQYGKPYDPSKPYSRKPFAVDVSEGKTDQIYRAHSYHTKVPHLAIVPSILQYTEPGDLVLDGFCGSGMTGVAAQWCGSAKKGYQREIEARFEKQGQLKPVWGARRAVLNDLSLAATFIAANYNLPFDVHEFARAGRSILDEIDREIGWMYRTIHSTTKDIKGHEDEIRKALLGETSCPAWIKLGRIEYTVWSEVFTCPDCTSEVVFLDEALDQETKRVRDTFPCPHCNCELSKKRLDRSYEARFDRVLGRAVQTPKRRPSLISYKVGKQRYEKKPDDNDIQIIERIQQVPFPQEIPTDRMMHAPESEDCWGDKWRAGTASFTHVHHLFLPRAAHALGALWSKADSYSNPRIRQMLLFFAEQAVWGMSILARYAPTHFSQVNQYLSEYQHLMRLCFSEYCRILKPGRWMTVVFHNSRNSVWTAIQEALQFAGFVVADVRVLDKKQGSFNQAVAVGSVKQDLVISAYKPNGGLEERFSLTAGTEDGVWDFVRTHLKQLPVFVSRNGQAEIIAERQHYLLFDRMVAFHVQRGVTVPMSAAEFYAGLEQRFPPRDGMYFLPDQAAEYDKKRMTVKEVLQLKLFVSDEASAIQWLKQQLTKKPQTFQDIHPQFLKEIGGWQKHEKALELSELLEQNFLRYDGKGPIPAQILSWMKQSADLRKIIQEELSTGRSTEENGQLETRNQELITRATARWYVPDPNKAGDLEKLRERALMREFEEYRESKQKRLKVFRLEAVRAGFKKAWQERDYATIVAVARKIPENILQEDPKLLMWYDRALTRTGEG